MTGLLQGRVIIVTGATKGIGRDTAIRLAREGAKVACTGRTEAEGAALMAEILAGGGEAIFIPQNVSGEADWVRVIARTENELGPVRGLVNNAGAFFVKPIAETTPGDVQGILDVNLKGAMLGVAHGFAAMTRSGAPGAIVNVSSLMGQVGFPGAAAYCASKGAVTGLTKSAAIAGAAMSPPVRVNSLHPGVIWTPMITSQFGDDPALADAFAADTPLRIIGLPAYMADAILFLLGDESSAITGAELTVDGGRGAD